MAQIKQTPAQKKVLMDLDSILKDLDKIENKHLDEAKRSKIKEKSQKEVQFKISQVREQIKNILEKRLQDRDIVIERKTNLLTAYKPDNDSEIQQIKTVVI